MAYLRLISRRGFQSASRVQVSRRAFSSIPALRAQAGYGDPTGNPAGANPQEQGSNPKSDLEHPGPPPPSAAGGDSSSASSQSSSSGSSKGGPKPAIHNESQPDTSSESVKKHNEELEQRNEKTHEKSDNEKVDPKFWKGHAEDKAK